MTSTGYIDAFNRTVVGGIGTADTGQAYTTNGSATYGVSPVTASITLTSAGSKTAYVDAQTIDADITGLVALSAVPATNQAFVGFAVKMSGAASSYYSAALMVATGGAISLRISKTISGTLTTLNTTSLASLGTYTAGAYFNLRFQAFWSNTLQANVLQARVWANGGTQPGGWQTSITDNSITQYNSGTQVGLWARDEQTAVGSVIATFRGVSTASYHLPMPALTDPMCNDPAIVYPDQTALQSLAAAADPIVHAFDPGALLAANYPRVRVSASNVSVPQSNPFITFDTTEFNIGTPTNLSYDNQALYLPSGIWLVTFEIELKEAASTVIQISSTGSGGPFAGTVLVDMRSNPTHNNSGQRGGTGHVSALTYSFDPVNAVRYSFTLSPATGLQYSAWYMAMSAYKISDFFL